jgi:hypothetical protein
LERDLLKDDNLGLREEEVPCTESSSSLKVKLHEDLLSFEEAS